MRFRRSSRRTTWNLVEVEPVTTSAHLQAIAGSDAHVTHCSCEDDAAQNAFATLVSSVAHVIDHGTM
jgi:hypothetical protein